MLFVFINNARSLGTAVSSENSIALEFNCLEDDLVAKVKTLLGWISLAVIRRSECTKYH